MVIVSGWEAKWKWCPFRGEKSLRNGLERQNRRKARRGGADGASVTSPVTSAVLAIRIDGQLSTAAQSQSRNGDILLLFFFQRWIATAHFAAVCSRSVASNGASTQREPASTQRMKLSLLLTQFDDWNWFIDQLGR